MVIQNHTLMVGSNFMGGRAAEMLIFDKMTTGAGNDMSRRRRLQGRWSLNGV